jgi:exosome complex exonuclease DIS3/RRP44
MEYYKPYPETKPPSTTTGILYYENDKFYVDDKEVINNRCFHNDEVFIDNGEVIGFKKRNKYYLVGILYLNTNVKYGFTKKNVPYYKFKPISQKYPDFIVPSKEKKKDKFYCVITFNKWDITNKSPIGQIEKFIGSVGRLNNEIEMLLYKTNIYPKKKQIEYCDLPIIEEKPEYITFSIDPKGCQDIDDALHYKELYNGFEVGIHIANAAKFIKEINMNIYSSIYLDNSQINMLSEKHSFELCSLTNKTNKRALSLILFYNKKYELQSYKFKECIIYNNAFSYTQADKINSLSFDKLNNLQKNIKDLFQLTKIINKDHELNATSMVESYMLLYNIITAKVLYNYNNNTILRTHKFISNLKKDNSILGKYLNKTNQNAALYQVNPDKTNHEGLDAKFYTHATSPIRRYVDIINQINLIKYLNSEEIIIETQIDEINTFSKKLRKFYNLYKKLSLIFKITTSQHYDAYIIRIKKNRVNIFIPDLELEHKFNIISPKLLETNEIISTASNIIINKLELNLYQKIKINLTSLKHEDIFDKKLHIEVLEPRIPLV